MSKIKGFTLVELMIVIVIIGLILAYAIPSYQRHVIVAKRTEAHNAILQIANAQERNNATYNQYATSMAAAAPSSTDLGLSGMPFQTSVDYNFAITAVNGYTITATAKGSTQTNDNFGVNCTTLSLNSLGQKTPLACWQ